MGQKYGIVPASGPAIKRYELDAMAVVTVGGVTQFRRCISTAEDEASEMVVCDVCYCHSWLAVEN